MKEISMEGTALDNLKNAVAKFLITDHQFEPEEASTAVDEYVMNSPDQWHENSDAKGLAEYLATEADDE